MVATVVPKGRRIRIAGQKIGMLERIPIKGFKKVKVQSARITFILDHSATEILNLVRYKLIKNYYCIYINILLRKRVYENLPYHVGFRSVFYSIFVFRSGGGAFRRRFHFGGTIL